MNIVAPGFMLGAFFLQNRGEMWYNASNISSARG